MRHGFSDETSLDITSEEFVRFATQKVAYLATLLQPEWLEKQKKLSPTKWAINALFQIEQAIDGASFSLRPADVTDQQRDAAAPVLAAARQLLAGLK